MKQTKEPAINYDKFSRFRRINRLHAIESARLLVETLETEDEWKEVPRYMRFTFLELGVGAYRNEFPDLKGHRPESETKV